MSPVSVLYNVGHKRFISKKPLEIPFMGAQLGKSLKWAFLCETILKQFHANMGKRICLCKNKKGAQPY
jgi:hypothetical protein